MKERAKMGLNRTGIQVAGDRADRMLEVVGLRERVPEGSEADAMKERREQIEERVSVGSVPVPKSIRGLSQAVMQRLKGDRTEVFISKLGERLAFERTGVRMYELLINKFESARDPGPVLIEKLTEFRDDEGRHFQLVREVMEALGADSTAVTPDADVAAVAGSGLLKVIADPRTTPAQSLQSILVAEEADNGEWGVLVRMAREIGADDLAERFESALRQEVIHLNTIHQWYGELILDQLRVG